MCSVSSPLGVQKYGRIECGLNCVVHLLSRHLLKLGLPMVEGAADHPDSRCACAPPCQDVLVLCITPGFAPGQWVRGSVGGWG